MGSVSVETRNRQKARAEARLNARVATLDAAGVSKDDRKKDPAFKRLAAEVRKARSRLAAIARRAEEQKKAAEQKAAKPAEPAAKKAKAKPAKEPKGQKGGKDAAAGGESKPKKAAKKSAPES